MWEREERVEYDERELLLDALQAPDEPKRYRYTSEPKEPESTYQRYVREGKL